MTLDAPNVASVHESIRDAGAAYDRLTACGVGLHVHLDDQQGVLTVLAYDEQGFVLGSLSPSAVVELACRGTRT